MGPTPGSDNRCDKTRRVLLVTFDFPPRRTSATYRMGNLARHLPSAQWQPTVLTIELRPGDLQEAEQFEKLPQGLQIERTRFWEVGSWETSASRAVRAVGGLQSPQTAPRPSLVDRGLRRLAAFVRSCLYFPDFSVGWVPFGFARGWKVLRARRFDAMFSSEPPRSASVVALLLKIVFKVPWVMELMDPWYPPKRPIRRRMERWFLRFMLRRADGVVVMTEGHGRDLEESFHVPSHKIHVIPNGFDEDDFREVVPSTAGASTEMCAPGYLHFSHFGTVYPRNSGRFFPALADLLRERPEMKDRIRVHLVGFPDENTRRSALQDGLREVVEVRSFIPEHAQALREMYASHCLLLFWGDPEFSRLAAAGKTYVYLRTGRPILAVTGQGTIRERMEAAGAGWVVDPEDTAAIKNTLCRIVEHYDRKAALPSAGPDYVAQFRWDRLACDLGRVLDEVVNRGR